MSYAAPIADMRFVLDEVAGFGEVAALPGYEAADPELVDAVLGEAAKFAESVLAPLNQPADRVGSVLENGVVRTPSGFREAYARYVEGGWNGLAADPEHGGQGLPLALATPVAEMWNAACMSFALCPLLNFAAIELLQAYGSPEQQRLYLRQARQRRMDRHDEFDRAAGRLGSRRADHPRACRPMTQPRRSLSDHRPEDLHHLRRP